MKLCAMVCRFVSRWKQPAANSNALVPFLQLPVELIDLVAGFLGPLDIALLAQVCRSMRVILRRHPSANRLPRADYFIYLALSAQGLPSQWVCDDCVALHPVSKWDIPTEWYDASSCPKAYSFGPFKRYNTRLQNSLIPIEHRHVQLALKYARLQLPKYRTYLRALLKPFHGQDYYSPLADFTAKYSAYPRIVMGDDGNLRFLLLSTWQYLRGSEDIRHLNLLPWFVCPHLSVSPAWHIADPNGLAGAIETVLEAQRDGEEKTGACSRCATDLSVWLSSGDLHIYIWQDFGPETSPFDVAWRSQTNKADLDGVKSSWNSGPSLYHEPGTVKELYSRGPLLPF